MEERVNYLSTEMKTDNKILALSKSKAIVDRLYATQKIRFVFLQVDNI